MIRVTLFLSLLLFSHMVNVSSLQATSLDNLKAGVVKVSSQTEGGVKKVGTGFIVRLEEGTAYIVTASHVIEGDPKPQVAFYPKANSFMPAKVLGLEGGDPNGLAVLAVTGNVTDMMNSLCIGDDRKVMGGEQGAVIGFPRSTGTPWMVTTGTVGGRRGSKLTFTGLLGEGNSGAPLLVEEKVVGIITQMSKQLGYAVPIATAAFALKGWGIQLPPPAQCFEEDIVGKDDTPMRLIPEGTFQMGSPDGEGFENEHPQHSVTVDAFYLDTYEVTVAQYSKFLEATGKESPKYWRSVNLREHGMKPVVGITWHDADSYCHWAEKRLPTEAEWEKAATGTKDRKYPWGNFRPNSTTANFGLPGSGRLYDDKLQPVGSYERGKSPEGIYDLGGNVWEWVSDWYGNYDRKIEESNPKGPSTGKARVLRGGSWYDAMGHLRSARRNYDLPSTAWGYYGFRCAQDAQ